MLDRRAADRDRLVALLALDDEELVRALGGRRREELVRQLARFDPAIVGHGPAVSSVCTHERCFPPTLLGGGHPRALFLLGEPGRLAKLARLPAVSIIGSTGASDYARELARSIAGELGAAGVAVTTPLAAGTGTAALEGACEGGGDAIAVLGAGLDRAPSARLRSRLRALPPAETVVSELPCGGDGRRWGLLSAQRIAVRLSQLVVLVEAPDPGPELAAAREAAAHGKLVAALPGRVTSPLARGPIALLRDGAPIVCGAADILELLSVSPATAPGPNAGGEDGARTVDGGEGRVEEHSTGPAVLEPRLRAVLECVASGRDTAAALTRAASDPVAVLEALCELELMGLLRRGDGGRYLPASDARSRR